MVIDIHTHMLDLEPPAPNYLEYVTKHRLHMVGKKGTIKSPADADRMLEENGVDFAVALAEAAPVATGLLGNERVAEFCRQSERLIPFACVNPFLTADPAGVLEHAVKVLGCRGLKLAPSYMYFAPNDSIVYPLYARVQELDVPVMFHTGTSVYPSSRVKYADPLLLDDLAVDFPRLQVIMAHGGRGFWYEEAAFLARLHANFYLEISGLPPKKLLEYYPELERIAAKVVWGSDWPDVPISMQRNIQDFCALPLSDKAKRLILEENARTLLQL